MRAYGASKAAVKLFTEALIAEHQDSPLKVSVVFPGGIATDILANSGVAMPGAAESDKAAGSLTTVEDAGREIVAVVERGAPRVRIGKDAQMLDRLSRLMPAGAIPLIARKMNLAQQTAATWSGRRRRPRLRRASRGPGGSLSRGRSGTGGTC
ncbi:SDR family NAD(P)-dependent oxidoreductase [Kribbella sp. GL6]|uniref:SDR family NAD(P)-dependent oxidoreductase n=1 Tax=Kribbella sp. GL6 TaxID=3419765 RepID=UPI003D00E6BE